MSPGLGYELHKLTARLDRAADELLGREQGISYARFLALFAVGETNGSQRDLAQWLGQTEPSTSRMVIVLAAEGLLEVTRLEGAGNRRRQPPRGRSEHSDVRVRAGHKKAIHREAETELSEGISLRA